jgi:hypothetical protein
LADGFSLQALLRMPFGGTMPTPSEALAQANAKAKANGHSNESETRTQSPTETGSGSHSSSAPVSETLSSSASVTAVAASVQAPVADAAETATAASVAAAADEEVLYACAADALLVTIDDHGMVNCAVRCFLNIHAVWLNFTYSQKILFVIWIRSISVTVLELASGFLCELLLLIFASLFFIAFSF